MFVPAKKSAPAAEFVAITSDPLIVFDRPIVNQSFPVDAAHSGNKAGFERQDFPETIRTIRLPDDNPRCVPVGCASGGQAKNFSKTASQ